MRHEKAPDKERPVLLFSKSERDETASLVDGYAIRLDDFEGRLGMVASFGLASSVCR